jgi:hypothetical protein
MTTEKYPEIAARIARSFNVDGHKFREEVDHLDRIKLDLMRQGARVDEDRARLEQSEAFLVDHGYHIVLDGAGVKRAILPNTVVKDDF